MGLFNRYIVKNPSLLLSVLFLVLFSTIPCFAEKANRSVLYINSYHNGYKWSDGILNGLRAGLSEGPYKIDFQIEYMDSKKFTSPVVRADLLALYQAKFASERFDAVVISDDDAFDFALRYRDQLFPGTPLIFCGVNSLGENDLNAGNLTGLVENYDFLQTVDTALRLDPSKKRMVVVSDNSTTSVAIRARIHELAPLYRDRLEIIYWTNLGLAEVQHRVKRLPDDTFIFMIPYYHVLGELFYTAEEVTAAISKYSSVPIYSSWGFLTGHGIVGGNVISGFEHGKRAAAKVISTLSGVPVEQIPVSLEVQGSYIFDYKVMKRLGLPLNRLPEESIILNEPNPFYKINREFFWIIIASSCLLLLVVCLLGFIIVARRKGEARMKNQLAFQETLIDTVPQLVSWKDLDGRYMGGNSAYADFFGLGEKTNVINENTRTVIYDKNYARWSIEADKKVVAGECEFRRVRKKIVDVSGAVYWLEVNKVPLCDERGRITGVLTTAEDVTRAQNLENQLFQSQKMEAIGTLAGGIAHDFNNILTSIINSTELAITDVAPRSQTEKDLERVLKAARRGGSVVKQILAFSKPSPKDFVATDVGAVVLEALQLIEVSLPSSVTVTTHIEENLDRIYADPAQLHQVVMNLCTNAYQALSKEGGELSVSLDSVELDSKEASTIDVAEGRFMHLSVSDNGIGLAPELVDKIFEPFFSLKEKSRGTGLGLSVVHGIVKGHNGAIRVESTPRVGTRFEIFLPYVTTSDSIQGMVEPSGIKRCERILFVEDDPEQLATVPRILQSFGFEVEAISDPKAAVARVIAAPTAFDLILTDYDMPKLNGVAMLKMMGNWAPDIPALVISGREEAIFDSQSCSAIKKVMLKPYTKNDIYDAIVAVLDKED